MWPRISFAAICAFWLVMNLLLWRSQSGLSAIGNETPVNLVWQKILTAPDNSSLDIMDHGQRIGFCHWTATSGEAAAANKRLQEDYAPGADAAPEPTAYALAVDGNAALDGGDRVRFDARLTLAPNQQWRDFHLRANVKRTVWDVEAGAASQRVALRIDQAGARWEQSFTFAQLANPQALLAGLGGSMALAMIPGASGLPTGTNDLQGLIAGMHWQAHEDHMQFGHSRVRVYRMDAQWFGQRVTIFVSMVGEILAVDFPNGLTLRHEAFDHF